MEYKYKIEVEFIIERIKSLLDLASILKKTFP